jgi:hypothetical protein
LNSARSRCVLHIMRWSHQLAFRCCLRVVMDHQE